MTTGSDHDIRLLDLAHLATEPGAVGPMAPPAQWSGDAAAYRDLIAERWRDPCQKQELFIAARLYTSPHVPTRITGPHAATAGGILERIASRHPQHS